MKNKKLTNKELANYMVNVENKFNHAIDIVGKMFTDFIEYKGDKENFIKHLKEKYKTKESEEKSETNSWTTKEIYY